MDGNASGNKAAKAATLTVTVNSGQEIWLRWNKTGSTSPGLAIDDFSITATGAASTPTITLTGPLSAVNTTYGTPASPTTFTVAGTNLTGAPGNLTVAPPAGYEASLSSGSGYTTNLSVPYSSATLAATNVYVRLAATTVPGSYSGDVTVSGGGASDKTIATASSTVITKALTVTGLAGADKVYDGLTAAAATGSATLNGVNGSDSVTLGGTPAYNFANKNVGTSKTITTTGYTISGAQAGYYTLTQPTLSANITATPLTITANDVTKIYGATLTGGAGSTAFTSSGLVNSESIGSVTITYTSGADAGAAAGSYPGVVAPSAATGGTFSAANYNLSYVAGDLTVSASPTIGLSGTLSALSTIYGTASATTTFSVSGGNLSGDLTVTPPSGFEVSTSAGSGYASTVTLTAGGGTVPSTLIYVRLAAATVPGTYSGNVTVSGGGADSQSVATVSSTVNTKELTITGLTGDNKVYDRLTNATATGSASLDGVNGSDEVTLGGTPAYSFANKGVANGKTITTTGYAISGAHASYYTLAQPTLSADITPLALTVPDAAVTTKTYDGTTSATITGTLTGVIAGDTVTFSGTGTFASAGADTSIAVTSTSTLSGADAGNYTLTQPTGLTGTINKANQTITFGALPTGKKVGDASFSAGATISSGQTISYASSNPNVATINASGTIGLVAAGVTTITASQAGDANYNAATPVSRTLNVASAGGGVITILAEDFSSLTVGADTSTTSAGSTEITTGLTTNFPSSSKTYSAGGTVKFGTGSLEGSMTSRALNLSANGGVYSVIFQVKGWSTVEGTLNVTAGGTTINNTYTATISGPYQTVTNTFSNGTANTTLIFATSAKRAFMDNVLVTQSSTPTPTITPAGSFSAVSTTYGTASEASATTVTVSGGSLVGDITASAPAGFEVSSDGTTYGSSATFAPTGGFANGTLYLRLAANASVSGSYNSGVIVLSSSGASSVNITTAPSGNSVAPAPLSVTANNASKCFGNTITFVGSEFTSSGLQNGETIGSVTLGSAGAASGAAAGSYDITPSAATGGTFTAANYAITYLPGALEVNPAPATSVITGPTLVQAGQAGSVYSVTLTSGSSYLWTVPAGASITAGATGPDNNSITVTFGTTSGNVTVLETAAGGCTGSLVSLAVSVNHNPVAANQTLGVATGGSASMLIIGGKNAPTDADGDALTVSAVTQGANGTVSFTSTNITYTSTGGGSSDSFTYTVSDGAGGSATATVAVTLSSGGGTFNQLSATSIAGGALQFTYLGIPGTNYSLEVTHDLTPPVVWEGVQTNAANETGSIIFTNTPSLAPTNDFYRTSYVP